MAAKQPKVMTIGLVVMTVAVLAVVVALIVSAFHEKGGVHATPTAQQQGHTLMPVTLASVKVCLSNQGLVTDKKSSTVLEAEEPGSKPIRLTFAKDFDAASATAVPGRALNNAVLSVDVADLTQLEIYAFDACIVQPGEKGGKGKVPTKKAPVESVTSLYGAGENGRGRPLPFPYSVPGAESPIHQA